MKNTAPIWSLEEVDLYDILCPHKVKSFSNNHVFKHFSKNEFIYFLGDTAQSIHMVAEGRVKIGHYTDDGQEVTTSILSKGELFGELAITGEEKRQDFALAMDNDTTICNMSIHEMQNLMYKNRELNFKVYKIIGLRLRKLERKVASLVFKDARTRIIEFLKDAAEEKGRKVGFEIMIPTKLTHKDIATLTGTSRQTVTTILNELKESNMINFDRRKILIRDIEQLA